MKHFYNKKNKPQILFLFLIFFVALGLRLHGLNWDNNFHLHPDERFLTMVTSDIKLPSSISQYFDTGESPLNPFNYSQYSFFVYGTFPVFLTKVLAVCLHLDNYDKITILGRFLSALFDSGNIFLLYLISKKLLKSFSVFLPSLFYTFMVLPLQLSHFFAVDTFLNFFILLTFTLFVYDLFPLAFFTFGLALSCKISALYFAPIIFLFLLKDFLKTDNKLSVIPKTLVCLFIAFISFRIFQPYSFIGTFTINPHFVSNLKTLASFSKPDIYYPPGVQWIDRLPLLNSLKNTGVWGFGLAIFLPLILLSLRYLKKIKLKFNLVFIISIWILFLFTYQSVQYVHAMRYMITIYPFVALILVALLSHFKVKKIFIGLIFLANSLYAFAFLSIYSRPVSRVQASDWIIRNIPLNKTLSSEYWDDALPVGYSSYKNISLAFFDPDTPEKWARINNQLSEVDYLLMSSNRLWASIPRLPDRYPETSKFYESLFSGQTDFYFIKKFVSYPGFSLPFFESCYYFGPSNYPVKNNSWVEKDTSCLYPGIYLRDDTAEEAFSVYDHPQVLIYERH